MNSVPNSDSEQCTESKLGWVHQMNTLNPSCAQRPRALHPCWPCRGRVVGLCPTLSWLVAGRVTAWPLPRMHSVPSQAPPWPCRARYRECRSIPAPCHRALLSRIAALAALYHHTRSPPLSHDTIFVS